MLVLFTFKYRHMTGMLIFIFFSIIYLVIENNINII